MQVRVCRWVITFVLLLAAPAYAQFDTASITGTVRDTSGAVVTETTVTLTNVETGVSATRTTNEAGLYEFTTVRPGTYVITGQKAGFTVTLMDGVQVQVGARQRGSSKPCTDTSDSPRSDAKPVYRG